MKKHLPIWKLFTVAIFLLPAAQSIASDRPDVPNDLTIELLGRCLVYSFSYQHMLGDMAGLEGGVSMLGGSSTNVLFFSGGVRLYVLPKNATPCITGGVVAVTSSTDSGPFSSNESSSYFYLGPGFEYRSTGGFLFRGTVYFLIRDGFFVWPGIQVGIAF